MGVEAVTTEHIRCRESEIYMKQVTVKIQNSVAGFSEDKDKAKLIRTKTILPAIERKQHVILDFSEVTYSTQSYVHPLIGEALQKYRDTALEQIEFKGCSPQLRSLVEMVVDYSFSGFPVPDSQSPFPPRSERTPRVRSRTKRAIRRRMLSQ